MNNMYEINKMLDYVNNLKLDKYNDPNMEKKKIIALHKQEIFYEILINITDFFNKGVKRGGIITPIKKNIKNIHNGITDIVYGFKNELDKITNGTRLLIFHIYNNMIFQDIYNTKNLKDKKYIKDNRNITIYLLKDLVEKYKTQKDLVEKYKTKKIFNFGGMKINNKKGGVAETIIITSIIITAIWALIQIYDNLNEKYNTLDKNNEINSSINTKLTPEMLEILNKINKEKKKQNKELFGIFNF